MRRNGAGLSHDFPHQREGPKATLGEAPCASLGSAEQHAVAVGLRCRGVKGGAIFHQ